MTTYEITDRRATQAPLTDIVERIVTPATWPEWQPEINLTTGPERVTEGDDVSGAASMLGFKVSGRATMTNVRANTVEQDVIVGIRMRVRYDVETDGTTTTVAHRLQTDLPGGILGRVLSLFLRPRLRAMQKAVLNNLAATSSDVLSARPS